MKPDFVSSKQWKFVPKTRLKFFAIMLAGLFFMSIPLGLAGERVLIQRVTPELIQETLTAQKDYLFRVMHPRHYGFYKKYDALTDTAETKLRTIYTASALYTLLKLDPRHQDPAISEVIRPIADFLLFMQVKEGPFEGAFHYSFDPESGLKDNRFVVGTASKTIFTLIELYKITGDSVYLESAQKAGRWLLRQTSPEGSVVPEVKIINGRERHSRKMSFLYSGQTLSALSRLYKISKDPNMFSTADRIANRLISKVKEQDYFVGDDFRKKNTISTTWAVKSLADFYDISRREDIREVILRAVDSILVHQHNDSADLINYGRFNDTTATSGNGWINEVLSEMIPWYQAENPAEANRIRDSVLKATRWLIQNTYTKENSQNLPNPGRALGGAIRNYHDASVRTDAVCHSANSFMEVLDAMREKTIESGGL